MRPMQLEFPDDPTVAYLDRQYMLGADLLVAPVFSEAGEVEYYLPAGTWTNYLTGETAQGPAWRRETHGMLSIPLWVRGGAVLPTGNRTDRPDYDYLDGLLVTVYPGGPATSTETTITSSTTGDALVVTVDRTGAATTVSVRSATGSVADVRVRLAGGDVVTTSNGKALLQ
jgi:alpha-D-xyloside xylohydrolase